jgi:hypothetical protein
MLTRAIQILEDKFGPLCPAAQEAIKYELASYGLACLMDSTVAKEAESYCTAQIDDEEE